MLIEVVKPRDATNKEKGDILEKLAENFLKRQRYQVSKQVRITASELDLLCKHKVSEKTVYVECKAHKDPLSVNVLKNLLGTIELQEYSEGWLISTGPLGKDAKGFMETWGRKKSKEKEKLSIYTPDRILTSLLDAKIITCPPAEKATELIGETNFVMGEWVLLLTSWGYYWACPLLRSGLANSVILFCARNADQISDQAILRTEFRRPCQ